MIAPAEAGRRHGRAGRRRPLVIEHAPHSVLSHIDSRLALTRTLTTGDGVCRSTTTTRPQPIDMSMTSESDASPCRPVHRPAPQRPSRSDRAPHRSSRSHASSRSSSTTRTFRCCRPATACPFFREVFAGRCQVRVKPFDGLLVDFARGSALARSCRATRAPGDFVCQLTMTVTDRRLRPGSRTVFFVTARVERDQLTAGRGLRAARRDVGGIVSRGPSRLGCVPIRPWAGREALSRGAACWRTEMARSQRHRGGEGPRWKPRCCGSAASTSSSSRRRAGLPDAGRM